MAAYRATRTKVLFALDFLAVGELGADVVKASVAISSSLLEKREGQGGTLAPHQLTDLKTYGTTTYSSDVNAGIAAGMRTTATSILPEPAVSLAVTSEDTVRVY
jgi:hypothetical protein